MTGRDQPGGATAVGRAAWQAGPALLWCADRLAQPRLLDYANRFTTKAPFDLKPISEFEEFERNLSGKVTDTRTYGDHVLIVGEVMASETDSGRPLLWHSQAFALLRT